MDINVNFAQVREAMGWMEFLSSLVASTAWPIAVVIVALVFKAQIAALLAKIRRLTWGDKTVDFADKLDKVETASLQVAVKEPQPAFSPSLPDDRFKQLLEISPSAAILDAWLPVEQLLVRIARVHGLGEGRRQAPFSIIRNLYSTRLIPEPVYVMLRDLQQLRNAAAHQQAVQVTDALRFDILAKQAISALRPLEGPPELSPGS